MSRKLTERRRFKRFLKELGVLTEFRRELKEVGKTMENIDSRSVEEKVLTSFSWYKTRKGHVFWHKIHEKIEQMEKKFNKKQDYIKDKKKLIDNHFYFILENPGAGKGN